MGPRQGRKWFRFNLLCTCFWGFQGICYHSHPIKKLDVGAKIDPSKVSLLPLQASLLCSTRIYVCACGRGATVPNVKANIIIPPTSPSSAKTAAQFCTPNPPLPPPRALKWEIFVKGNFLLFQPLCWEIFLPCFSSRGAPPSFPSFAFNFHPSLR